MVDSEYLEFVQRKLDRVAGFLDYPPHNISADDLNALGDRLRRLSDDAYMHATRLAQREAA